MRIELEQGGPEWHAHRAAHYNASEASAMLGQSPYKTRSALIREKATGNEPEIDEHTQARFDRGHEIEAIARVYAEEHLDMDLDDSLKGCVYADVVDGLPLSASLDGLCGDIGWECKTINAELRESLANGVIPPAYHPQMEQGLMLSGATRCLFTASDGTREGTLHAWYMPRPEVRIALLRGWKQFAQDLATYTPEVVNVAPLGRAPETLPALRIEVTGMVTASNLAEFKAAALAVFHNINTNLQTDQQFADAEKAVKFCKDAEERLELTKSFALAQTASIEELFRAIDAIKEEARTVRLRLEKLVKAEKENRKAEIAALANSALSEHVEALRKRVGGPWVPMADYSLFVDAIKGLKSIDSMRDRVSVALANAKIEANSIADLVQINKTLLSAHEEYRALFPDMDRIIAKPATDFADTVNARIAAHKAEQEAILESVRARIRAEEEAKARAAIEAEARAAAELERLAAIEKDRAEQADIAAKSKAEADERLADAIIAKQPNTHPEGEPAMPAWAVANEAQQYRETSAGRLKLGEIQSRLGFNVTSDFLAKLGFTSEKIGNAMFFGETDFPRICAALIRHITNVASRKKAA